MYLGGAIIYCIIRANKENGLFYYTAFEMYLKEKGLSDEEIERESYGFSRQQNRLSDTIGTKHLTEKGYRDEIVRFRKKNNIKNL